MSRFLVKLGFQVAAASDGEEGLKLAKRIRPIIITLDVVMPGMDGWGVLKRLKSDPDLSTIPVIMVTIVDNEVTGINLGASSYLVKPVDRDRLAELIERYRGGRLVPSSPEVPVGVAHSSDDDSDAKVRWDSRSRRN
jgi:DNA-binding response OmpR family regulator